MSDSRLWSPVAPTAALLRRGVGPSAWVRAIALMAAAVLLVAGGWYAKVAVDRAGRPADTSAEVGFARDMTVHHQQAVYMAILALEHGSTSEIRQLGHDIVLIQQAEIGTMAAWLTSWRVPTTSGRPPMEWMPHRPDAGRPAMPGMATDDELRELQAARARRFDVLFCRLMMRHHLGGRHMIEGILTMTHHADVRRLATAMARTQQNEVAEMARLLDAWDVAAT